VGASPGSGTVRCRRAAKGSFETPVVHSLLCLSQADGSLVEETLRGTYKFLGMGRKLCKVWKESEAVNFSAGQDGRGVPIFISVCPSESDWFSRFSQGM
jgi:hypothetical protein